MNCLVGLLSPKSRSAVSISDTKPSQHNWFRFRLVVQALLRASVGLATVLILLTSISLSAFGANPVLSQEVAGGSVRFDLDFISLQPSGVTLNRGTLHVFLSSSKAIKVYEQSFGEEVVTNGIAYQPRNFVYNWTTSVETSFETPDETLGRISHTRFDGRATTYGVQVIHWIADGQYMATNNPYLVLPQGLHYQSYTMTHELTLQSSLTQSDVFSTFYLSIQPERLPFLQNLTKVPYGGEEVSPFEVTGEVDYIGTDIKGSLRLVTGDLLERTLAFRVTRLKIVGGTITGDLLRPGSATDELYIISIVSILSESERASGVNIARLIQFYYFPQSLLLGELRSEGGVQWQKGISAIRIPVNMGEDYRPIAENQLTDLYSLQSEVNSLEQSLSNVRSESARLLERVDSIEAKISDQSNEITFLLVSTAAIVAIGGAFLAITLKRRHDSKFTHQPT